jgi:hypothetical protein
VAAAKCLTLVFLFSGAFCFFLRLRVLQLEHEDVMPASSSEVSSRLRLESLSSFEFKSDKSRKQTPNNSNNLLHLLNVDTVCVVKQVACATVAIPRARLGSLSHGLCLLIELSVQFVASPSTEVLKPESPPSK